MRLTNTLSLPQPIVDAVRNDSYSRGAARRSVTELIGPARMVALARKHADQLEEDVADRIYSLIGQAAHRLLERANVSGVAEKRLSTTVHGWVVSGQFDYLAYSPVGELDDWKVTSVWAVLDGRAKPEHEAQLNLYAYLLRLHEHDVSRLQVVAILRDWSKLRALRERGYPQKQVVVLPVPLWSLDEQRAYLEERVAVHQAAEHTLPDCTPEERWQRSDVYALMKNTNKRAVKLYDSDEAANEAIAQLALSTPKAKFSVVKRPGTSTRCESYCAVGRAGVCDQWNRERADSTTPASEDDLQPMEVVENG